MTPEEVQQLIDKLRATARMPELDALRPATVSAMQSDGTEETFKSVQSEFIKAKNRLRRIPLAKRDW